MTSTLDKTFIAGLKDPTQPSSYPKNWTKISNAYRKYRGYICEICGVNCSAHPELTDAHHKNGVKEDCRYENLECLCKYHHAELHPHYRKIVKEKDPEVFRKLEKLWEEQNIPHDKYNFHRDVDDNNKEVKPEYCIAISGGKIHFYYCSTLQAAVKKEHKDKYRTIPISKMDLRNKESLGTHLTWCKNCIDVLCHNGRISQGHILNQIAEHGNAEELMACVEAHANDSPSAVKKIQNFVKNTIGKE